MTRKTLIVLFCAIFAAQTAFSQEYECLPMTRSRAEKLVARPVMQPVPSLEKRSKHDVIDTLDTSNPALKIVLFKDNTWEFCKDPDVAMSEDNFKKHWTHEGGNPYRIEFSEFPLKAVISLVDSSSHYHYPCSVVPPQISSKYGRRRYRWHRGIDLRAPTGTPVYATFNGKVRVAKYVRGYGNLVVIRHDNGLETFYGHMSKINVEVDDWVYAGDVIGLCGSTGRSSGPHIHYEVRYLGYAIDPEWMIDFETTELRHQIMVIKKKFLDPACKYVPESDDEEDEIADEDERDRLEAERIEAEMKAAKYHKIRSGDTLGGIARKYGTSVNAICKLNGISSKTTLRVGRTIRVK